MTIWTATDTAITGKVNYRGIGNAKLNIDRTSGIISVRGPEGNFSGTCTPYDPA